MTSIKIKFRPSPTGGDKGTICFQVIKDRVTRQLRTDYRIAACEWDAKSSRITAAAAGRAAATEKTQAMIERDTKILSRLAALREQRGEPYTAADVLHDFRSRAREFSLFGFMREQSLRLKELGKARTSETYMSALNSFRNFMRGTDIIIGDMDSPLLMSYEAYLKERGVAMNTVSFYMRILRAVYNKAVERDLTEQRHPFRHVYTGVDKTVKRAIPLQAIKRIKELELPAGSSLELARDLFMLSFYTRGMSFVDMAWLRKDALRGGVLSYRRRKTGQQLFIKWEKCMQDIVDRHATGDSPYLLPVIRRPGTDEHRQYKNSMLLVNRNLKEIGAMAKLSSPLTMYVGRHSWASIAKSRNIPLSVISEGMGHDSETTTQIYLASLSTAVVDKANRHILSLL